MIEGEKSHVKKQMKLQKRKIDELKLDEHL